MSQPIWKTLLAALFLTWGGDIAFADTVTTQFQVTAQVNARCFIDSASTMDFGSSYDPSEGV